MRARIRPFDDRDAEAVVDLSLRTWAPVFASLERVLGSDVFGRLHPDWRQDQRRVVEDVLAAKEAGVWVAEADGTAVGFVAVRLHPESGMGEIYMLAVDPDHQGGGIGTALTEFALEKLKDDGMAVAMVETGEDPGHAAARRTYEKAGFVLLPIARYFKMLGERVRAPSVQRERSCDDLACRRVRTDNDSSGGDLAVEEPQPGGDGAFREQAFTRPDDEGEDPQAALIDEVVAQQRLDQVPAAMHLQLRTIFLLECRDALGRVSLYQHRLAPLQRGMTPRRNILGGVFQRPGPSLLRGVRPVRCEDIVGLASENELERPAHRLAHDLTHLIVPVVHPPAAVREAAAIVLFGSARSLHDLV